MLTQGMPGLPLASQPANGRPVGRLRLRNLSIAAAMVVAGLLVFRLVNPSAPAELGRGPEPATETSRVETPYLDRYTDRWALLVATNYTGSPHVNRA